MYFFFPENKQRGFFFTSNPVTCLQAMWWIFNLMFVFPVAATGTAEGN